MISSPWACRFNIVASVCSGAQQLGDRFATVWGQSCKHIPQRVGLKHELEDEDVVQAPSLAPPACATSKPLASPYARSLGFTPSLHVPSAVNLVQYCQLTKKTAEEQRHEKGYEQRVQRAATLHNGQSLVSTLKSLDLAWPLIYWIASDLCSAEHIWTSTTRARRRKSR